MDFLPTDTKESYCGVLFQRFLIGFTGLYFQRIPTDYVLPISAKAFIEFYWDLLFFVSNKF